FAQDGKIKWQFTPGRSILFGNGQWSTDIYYVHVARVLRFQRGSPPQILVSSGNSPGWTCQVALLDGRGRLLGEYWHHGHLSSMALADLEGDGSEDVLLGGVNNLFGQATLVLLDPHLPTIPFPAHQQPFRAQRLVPGAEKHV